MNPAIEDWYPSKPDMGFLQRTIKSGCTTIMLRHQWSLGRNQQAYSQWLQEYVRDCTEFYFIVEVPINFLGTREITDKVVSDYVSGESDKIREKILAVHFSHGQIDVNDYLLRLYALLRRGFSYGLVVDDLKDWPGGYRNAIYDAVLAIMSEEEKFVPSIAHDDCMIDLLVSCFRKNRVISIVRNEMIGGLGLWLARHLNRYKNSRNTSKRLTKV